MFSNPDIAVLVVDDNEINLMLMGDIFEMLGVKKVKLVSSGKAAIAEVSQETYSLILMDISMPGMDGFEATAKIRASGYQGKIVALTANSLISKDPRLQKARMNDFLLKPVDIKDIQKLMSS